MPQQRKSLSDALKVPPFYPDLPKANREDWIGQPVILHDWKVIKDWNSNEYGSSSFALVAISSPESDVPEYTTIFSGVAVLKTLSALNSKGIKNVETRLIRETTNSGNEMWRLI